MKKLLLLTVFLLSSLISSAQVPVNDNCSGAISLGTLPTPAACPSGIGTTTTIAGTNINATAPNPYTTLLGCQTGGNQPGPALDVWYSFVASGNQVNINITPGVPALASPAITLWTGSCAGLIGYNCDNNGTVAGNNSVTFQPLTPGQTYYIQVSGMNNVAQGNFNMSVNASNDCNNCLQTANLTVTPAPVNGTYPPGTTVNFCYHITAYTQVSANWLHAVIPTFGCGWDLTTLVPTPPPSCSGSGTWGWYNTWTSSANASVWGPGFGFNTLPADANPGNNFGDNCATPNWNFCWSIKTKASCACTNLNVSINTAGDGESGSWTSIACLGDPNYSFGAVMSCCSVTAAVTNPNCFGGTGSATATPGPSGVGPFTYSWNSTPVQTTQTATNLPAGTYTCTVTDFNGCVSSTVVTITQPPLLNATTTTVNATCSLLNGSATANPSGGTGPYTYSWNSTPVQTTQTATGLGAGTYTCTITDSKGCIKTVSVTVTSTGSITATATGTNVSCFGGTNGSATANPVGGGPYTYSWNSTPVQTTQTATNLPAGTYTVTVNSLGCIATATVTITQPTLLNATSTQVNVTCFGGNNGSATANPTGGTAPYTYLWSNGQTTQTAINLVAGVYSCTITDAKGCTKVISVTITQPTIITVTTTQVNTTCGLPNGSATANPVGGVGPYTYLWSNGQTTQTAINLLAGPYTVTVTGVGGCTATANVTILNTGAPTVTIPSHVNVSCFGGTNGSATSNVVGGVGPFTYSWNSVPVQTTSNASNLPAGTYTLTVTGSNGCSATATVTITQPTLLTATNTHINVLCFGGNNGTGTANPSGGTVPYTYLWSNGQTTQTAINLVAGVYSCTVTDSNGCTVSTSLTVTQPTQLTSTNAHTNVSCFGGTNGTATVTPAGGTGPYTYSWNSAPIQTTQTATNLPAGNYICTITDANGCVITQNVTVTQPTQLTVTTTQINTTCGLPNGSATANPSGGTGPYTYSWNTIPVQTTQTASAILAGTYNCTVTDANGCQVVTTVNVSNTGAPTVTIPTHINVSCFGGTNGSANSNVVGGVGPFTYSWNSIPVQTTANATNLPAGTYTLTVTGSNGCSATATVTITQPTQLVSSITTTNVSCFGGNNGSATSSPSGGVGPYTYSWNSTPIQTTQTATNLPLGTYNCTVTDANGCQIVVSANITQPTQVTLALGSQTNISCFGGSNGAITVVGAGGTGVYLYSLNAGPNQLSPTFTGLTAGTYTIKVTDANGCNTTINVVLTQPTALSTTGSITNITCFGSCNGQLLVNVSGGVSPYTYLWSNGQTTNPATGLCAGSYSVVATDANGCQVSQTGMIVSQPNLLGVTVNATPSSICVGQTSNLTTSVVGGTAPYTYLWSNGGVTSNISVSPVVTTSYTVTITDANGCTTTGSVTVNVNPVLTINASATPTSICAGQSSTLSANAGGGNGGPYTFVWSPGGVGQTINVTPATTTVYTVTVSDGCSPSVSTTVTVTVNPAPIIAFSTTPLSGCEPLTVTYTNLTSGVTNCVWTINGVPYNSCVVTHTFPVQGTYNSTLTVTDANGCSATSPNVVANVYPIPTAAFNANPTITDILNPSIVFNNTSSIGSYSWNFGDGNTSNITFPTHVYGDTGTYQVQLIVTTSHGCIDTAYGTVHIDDIFAVYVPNAFTPNADGHNDTFVPVVTGAEKFTFWIFDRWGEMIYQSDAGTPWDATYKGTLVQQDVYVWKLIVIDKRKIRHEYIGHVTIVK